MTTATLDRVAVDLRERGHKVVEAGGVRNGIGFSPEALRALESIIENGIISMIDHNETDPPHLTMAQDNLARFVDELAREAKAQSDPVIEEHHVMALQAKFCPVFPFK